MTEVLKVKLGILTTLVLQVVALVYFTASFQVGVERDVQYLRGQIAALREAVTDINKDRWTSANHDRYAREIERRLVRVEGQ